MIKSLIVYWLPLEVWMDIFCFPWVSREQFGQFIARIGNFKFAEHAQFFLHEWGKRTLGRFSFNKKQEHIYHIGGFWRYQGNTGLPRTAVPENVKSFQKIEIRYFDAQVLDFLGRIRPLLNDLEIDVSEISLTYLDNLRTILTNLLPLLDGTHTLCCRDAALGLVKQCFGKQFNKLKMLRIIFGDETETEMQQKIVDTVLDWLLKPAEKDGPKLCQFHLKDDAFIEKMANAIRQQFFSAKTPCTFAVNLKPDWRWTEFHLENGLGEELNGEWSEARRERVFQIIRHQQRANCNQQLQEWVKRMTTVLTKPCICVDSPTIGSLDAPQMVVPAMDLVEQDNQQKPGSSKDT